MMLLDHFRHQFKYDAWANGEQLRVLSEMPDPPEPAVKLLNHILAAQWLWLDRLQKAPQRTPVWPQTSLLECGSQLQELEREWQSYLGRLSEPELAQMCSYKNSRGEDWTSSVADILNQLILHAAHHRGQISLEIRRSGKTPAPVDYIHAVRKGLLA
jgi:uncharacterized damage-inducible protein DinB